jgi:hypothetical protein
MVAVVIAAIISGGAVWCAKMSRLSRYYRSRAAYYELRYDDNRKKRSDEVKDWEGRLMMKYQILTLFPWRLVEPDPTEPK